MKIEIGRKAGNADADNADDGNVIRPDTIVKSIEDWLVHQAMDEFGLPEEQINNLYAVAAGLLEDGQHPRLMQELDNLDQQPVNPVFGENQENNDPNWEQRVALQEPGAAMRQLADEVRELEERGRMLREENHSLVEELRRVNEERQAMNEAFRAIELNRINEERQAMDEALRAIELNRILHEEHRNLAEALRRMEDVASVREHQHEVEEDTVQEIPHGEANRVPQDDHQRTF
ncbi:Protein CBG17420 [Caenorhabditis briggsae]|nr:Protein CBG17420 [Caenorhabditis briggsae]CAP35081.2 Protein CBG17420 [Caenorhabditis briggsae]